jgi:hypothetical protein
MKRFLNRYSDRIVGVIEGFDRILFRGTFRSISNGKGLERFLCSQHIRYQDFGKFAERITNVVSTHAKEMARQEGREYRFLRSSEISKEEVAREIAKRDQITEGLVCVLASVEPCQSFEIHRDGGGFRFFSVQRKCTHLYFYYLDTEFGWMHIRLQSWLPLQIQVCLNGREYLARALKREGIGYEQRDNCFVRIDDLKRAQQLLDRLHTRKWERVLGSWARRVNPWLAPKSNPKLHGYYWTMRQVEYATDLIFRDRATLDEIYPALADHAIKVFSSRDVLRFLGRRTNSSFNGEVQSNYRIRIEGLCVKHWVEENSIKIYNKQGSVLRIETTINNPMRFRVRREVTRQGQKVQRWVPMRKGIVDLKRRVDLCRAANGRYLDALAVVGEPKPSHRILDEVSRRIEVDGRPYRALHPISPEESRLFRVIMQGEFQTQGIRNQDLRSALEPEAESDPEKRRRSSSRATRQLRLLCAHKLIYKLPHNNYYRITKRGHEVMATVLRFRDCDIALLAA